MTYDTQISYLNDSKLAYTRAETRPNFDLNINFPNPYADAKFLELTGQTTDII